MIGFRLILFLIVVGLVGNSLAQTRNFSEAKGSGPGQDYYEFARWDFSISENHYQIGKNGKGKRINSRRQVTDFRLYLEKDESIGRVLYFAKHKNDLILLYEIEGPDYGTAYIIGLNEKTLKRKWKAMLSGFNISKGLIEGNSAYLGAIGFAAKINLETGKYIWKHEDFYRKYNKDGAFNIFETPQIEGNEIIYTERQEMYQKPPNIIKFNKISGKVIQVKVN